MKSSMVYGTNTFGNTDNAPKYAVKLTRVNPRGEISISFNYEKPAPGQGVRKASGSVKRVSLTLPVETARALSHALQLALAETASTDFEFKISEAADWGGGNAASIVTSGE